ncbi:hypothetical protein E9099_13270 [Psychroserpens sp. NJDZ02]|nr:hypothetical protein E9099_13270 [Psychroserpens sp. NJDZ02]
MTMITMLKKLSFILLLFCSCTDTTTPIVIRETVTEAMVTEQEKLCPDKDEIKTIEKNIKAFIDTTSVIVIKTRLKANLDYYLNNKDTIIKTLAYYEKSQDDEFKSITKLYLSDEERYNDNENMSIKLVNNNHIKYRDTVQSGTYFNQIFKEHKSALETRVRNNGTTVYKFETEQTIQPHYYLNFDSEKELRIMNIYYHDGTSNDTPTPIEPYSFPLNSIPVDQMKHVDSLQMEFKIMYLSKIDSIHFKKNEIGVQKGPFKLLKMSDNYLEYETPDDYYPYHKGSIIEEVYYNKNEKVLDTKFSISNCSTKTTEEKYEQQLYYKKSYSEYLNSVNTKEQLFLTLKYLDLKHYNAALKETRKTKIALKGNADSFTLYLENRRDTITFLTTLKNTSPAKNLYLHKLEDTTEFIDKNGKIITAIPSPINFLYSGQSHTHSDHYFFTDTKDIKDRTYYYINQEQQVVSKLPYSQMDFLTPSLLQVRENDKAGFKFLSTEKNQLLSDKTFTRSFIMRYTGEGISVHNDEGNYMLYDQNNTLITYDSGKITKITLKEML